MDLIVFTSDYGRRISVRKYRLIILALLTSLICFGCSDDGDVADDYSNTNVTLVFNENEDETVESTAEHVMLEFDNESEAGTDTEDLALIETKTDTEVVSESNGETESASETSVAETESISEPNIETEGETGNTSDVYKGIPECYDYSKNKELFFFSDDKNVTETDYEILKRLLTLDYSVLPETVAYYNSGKTYDTEFRDSYGYSYKYDILRIFGGDFERRINTYTMDNCLVFINKFANDPTTSKPVVSEIIAFSDDGTKYYRMQDDNARIILIMEKTWNKHTWIDPSGFTITDNRPTEYEKYKSKFDSADLEGVIDEIFTLYDAYKESNQQRE